MNNEEVVNKWIAFHSNMKQISTELEDALSKGEHPITLNEYYSLHYLNETEGNILRMTDLSTKISLSLSATSRMLAKFENTCGVIERFSSAEDKRGVCIKLTPKGKKYLENTTSIVIDVLNRNSDKIWLYTKSGAWKNSSPGFQFLYTKRQISNIIKV